MPLTWVSDESLVSERVLTCPCRSCVGSFLLIEISLTTLSSSFFLFFFDRFLVLKVTVPSCLPDLIISLFKFNFGAMVKCGWSDRF